MSHVSTMNIKCGYTTRIHAYNRRWLVSEHSKRECRNKPNTAAPQRNLCVIIYKIGYTAPPQASGGPKIISGNF
jgi:hypothetical protein